MEQSPAASITHLKDLQTYLHMAGKDRIDGSNPDFFRLMHGVLDPLIGRCDHLTHLRISTIGNGDEDRSDFSNEK